LRREILSHQQNCTFRPSAPPLPHSDPATPNADHWIDPADIEGGQRVLIGKGSFGSVYRNIFYHSEEVAVKVLLGSADEQTQNDFLEEINLLMKLRSPRVVQTFGGCVGSVGHGQQQLMIVMKLIAGGTLYDKLRQQPRIGWTERFILAVDVAEGIVYLHQQKVIHRDLKSLNVLVDADGRATLCDFGLAKVKKSTRSTSTSSGQGTPLWMAPELFARGKNYAEASDVYALAMVLVELATGRVPFEEKMDGQTAFVLVPELLRQGARPELPASTTGPAVPERVPLSLQAIIQSAWAQDTSARPTAKQCLEQLKEAAAEDVGNGASVGGYSQSTPPPSPPTSRTLNTVVSQVDMITSTAFRSLQMVTVNEVCAVKRSDGEYKYGRVEMKEAASAVILVDEASKATKTFVTAQVVDPQMLRKLVPREGRDEYMHIFCTHASLLPHSCFCCAFQ
jgi:serine/threonine protein kinase